MPQAGEPKGLDTVNTVSTDGTETPSSRGLHGHTYDSYGEASAINKAVWTYTFGRESSTRSARNHGEHGLIWVVPKQSVISVLLRDPRVMA